MTPSACPHPLRLSQNCLKLVNTLLKSFKSHVIKGELLKFVTKEN